MFWEKKLTQWVQDIQDRANLPARLVLWDGQQHDFGSFAAPQVTLHVKSATALPYLLEPSLDNLGEAYVKGKIDIEGKLSDIINIGYGLAKNTVTSASKLARVRRYFNHRRRRTRKPFSTTTMYRTSSTSCGSTRTWSTRARTSRTAMKISRPHRSRKSTTSSRKSSCSRVSACSTSAAAGVRSCCAPRRNSVRNAWASRSRKTSSISPRHA